MVFFCLSFLDFAHVRKHVLNYTKAMQTHAEMLVVSSSRTIREGLQSLALALPHVKAVYTVNCDRRSLLKLDEAAPSLVLLDCTLPIPKCQELLAQAKMQWPHIRSIVLVDTHEERLQLENADVDTILLRGIPAVRLLAILKRLLPSLDPNCCT